MLCMASKTRPSQAERALYAPVKKALTAYLRQGDDAFSIMLEVTADGFPERVKALLQDNVLFLLNSKEARPDLFGHIGPDGAKAYGRSVFFITVEVKHGAPTIHDVFQARKYGELYWAQVALLVSTEPPEERLQRLLKERLDLLGYSDGYNQLYLCKYSESNETIDWWFQEREARTKQPHT